MTTSSINENKTSDPFAGIFASMVLALLTSNFLTKLVTKGLEPLVGADAVVAWAPNIVAGLFVGIVAADPVGVLVQKRPLNQTLVRLFFGVIAGVLLQSFVVTPVAGNAMSMFVLVMIATCLIPVFMGLNWLQDRLHENGIVFGDVSAGFGLRIMSWSDRILIIATMTVSFLLFWFFGDPLTHTFIALAVILGVTTVYVSFANIETVEEDPWFYAQETEVVEASVKRQAVDRLKELSHTMLPGAILLGGVTRVAVEVVQRIIPNLDTFALAEPAGIASVIGVVLASGLGIVLFGMLTALGFGLGLLLVISRMTGRDPYQIRERCLRLVRILCFRQLRLNRQTAH